MFSLYINDLPDHIPNCHVSLYADDTAIVVSDTDSNSLQRKLESGMNLVTRWYQKNKLSLNLKKYKFMLIGTQPSIAAMKDVNVNIGSHSLERVATYKYLGIMIDECLIFDAHVQYMKKKTFSKVKLLGRLKWVLDRDTLLLLYKTLILPIIDYGDTVYHGISQQDAYCLQKLQNTAHCMS